jgi:hypothetical protein
MQWERSSILLAGLGRISKEMAVWRQVPCPGAPGHDGGLHYYPQSSIDRHHAAIFASSTVVHLVLRKGG